MHSSRMRTARSSSRHGGGVGLDQIPLNFPLGCGPGPDPLNFPLGCVPGDPPPSQIPLNPPPLGCGPGNLRGMTPPPDQAPAPHPPVNRITDTCKNITLPQTSYAGGKNGCTTHS